MEIYRIKILSNNHTVSVRLTPDPSLCDYTLLISHHRTCVWLASGRSLSCSSPHWTVFPIRKRYNSNLKLSCFGSPSALYSYILRFVCVLWSCLHKYLQVLYELRQFGPSVFLIASDFRSRLDVLSTVVCDSSLLLDR